MLKMKQATLFSLKSWKKVAAEDILKYKDILDKKDVTETVILRTLMSLKKKNPTKDSVLSTGIDSSLKLLENHSNANISNEVRMLLKHWKLESSSNYPNTIKTCKNMPSKTCNELDIKIEKIIDKISKKPETQTLSVTNVQSDLNISKVHPAKQCPTKVCTKLEEKNKEVGKTSSISQAFKTQSVQPVTKMQTSKQICKESTKQIRKNELNRRLQCAIQLFMEEVGKQEVRLYLEEQASVSIIC